ncbi:MAG: integrase core domain-containing protein [Marmoricola sp.]
MEWLEDQGVKVVFIAKASPWQNGINERFNGTMERELFGHEVYHSILEIQYVVDAWTEKYNTMRVHRALAGQTPAAYAKMLNKGQQTKVVVAIEEAPPPRGTARGPPPTNLWVAMVIAPTGRCPRESPRGHPPSEPWIAPP